jgi:molybdate transport system ATP-binding protein
VPTAPATSLEPGSREADQLDGDPTVLVRIRHADVYRGRDLVLKNVDWQIRRGEHTAIKGANGAGKTTFAGLIAGTIPAATGAEIVRFGQTGPFDIWKLKERIAHVSDDLQIAYDRGETVEAVVASGFPSSIGLFMEPTPGQRATIARVLDRIGLGHLAERTFTQLSFGERRKVLIARSLVRKPDIFILDEIWNGLDLAFRQALRGLLGDMAQAGTTIVAIAHDESDEILAPTRRVCFVENRNVRVETPGLQMPEVGQSSYRLKLPTAAE